MAWILAGMWCSASIIATFLALREHRARVAITERAVDMANRTKRHCGLMADAAAALDASFDAGDAKLRERLRAEAGVVDVYTTQQGAI